MRCPKLLRWLMPRRGSVKAYNEIDANVKPLVDAMNSTGVIETVASCQGHAAYGKSPYIYFKSSPEIAASIEKRLRELLIDTTTIVGGDWTIKGTFNEKCELLFLLYSPFYSGRAHSLLAPIEFFLYRRRIAAELLSLAGQIEEAVLPDVGENFKPKVTTNDAQQDKAN